jgi:GTP-dependent phosphoenolpyruvate carboxykinase
MEITDDKEQFEVVHSSGCPLEIGQKEMRTQGG